MRILKYSLAVSLAAFCGMLYGNLSQEMPTYSSFDIKLELNELQARLNHMETLYEERAQHLNQELLAARQNLARLEKENSLDADTKRELSDAIAQKRAQMQSEKKQFMTKRASLNEEMALLSGALCAQTQKPAKSQAPQGKSNAAPAPTQETQPSAPSCGKKQCPAPSQDKKKKSACCYVAPQACPQPSCQKPCAQQPKPCNKVDPNCVPPAQATQATPCPQPSCKKPCVKEPKPCKKVDPNCVPPAQATQGMPCPQPSCKKPCVKEPKPCKKVDPNCVPPAQATQGMPCPQPSCKKPCVKEPKPCKKVDPNCVPPAQATQGMPCPQPSCKKPCVKEPKPCKKVDPNCVPPAQATQAMPCPQPSCKKPCGTQPLSQNTCQPCIKASPKQPACVKSKMCQKDKNGRACQRNCATPPAQQPKVTSKKS